MIFLTLIQCITLATVARTAPPPVVDQAIVNSERVSASSGGWPLFQAYCLGCHQSGLSAPLILSSRAAILRKGPTITTVLNDHFMPANCVSGGGPFVGIRSAAGISPPPITQAMRAELVAWIQSGADGAPDVAIETPSLQGPTLTVASGWEVPADGIHMRTFVVSDAKLPARVASLSMRRASAAVERVMVSIDGTGHLRRLDEQDPGDGAHTRGDAPRSSAGSFAMLGVDSVFALPKGWSMVTEPGDLVAELHAVSRGAPMQASVTLAFQAGNKDDRTAETFVAGPLGALSCERRAGHLSMVSGPVVVDAEVGTIGVRTDERCTALKVSARSGDGTTRELLAITKYREGLDRALVFDPPVALSAGTTLVMDFSYGDEPALQLAKPMVILWCARTTGSTHGFPRVPDASQSKPVSFTAPEVLQPSQPALQTQETGLTWYEAAHLCNTRSLRDGLSPAYRIQFPQEIEGRILAACVEPLNGNGWRLPSRTQIKADPARVGAGLWWWTEDPASLSGMAIVSPVTGMADLLPPSSKISGVWAAMIRPEFAAVGK